MTRMKIPELTLASLEVADKSDSVPVAKLTEHQAHALKKIFVSFFSSLS